MPETITLFAAGSLKSAMSQIAQDFKIQSGIILQTRFGAAGGLRELIENGEPCDVFASANMEHPQRLHDEGQAEAVFRFAANTMCAVLRPGLASDSANICQFMERPDIRIGTSTPVNDPCGDYAVSILRKAGIVQHPDKTIIVTGGAGKKMVRRDGLSDYSAALVGITDMLLIYKTLAARVTQEIPGSTVIELPPELAEIAHYGITAIRPVSKAAKEFIAFVLGDHGQQTLIKYGFEPI